MTRTQAKKKLHNEIRRDRMRLAMKKGTHTRAEWESLKFEFSGRCVLCGADERKIQKDHIIPIYKGGSDAITNLQPLCAQCNASKGPDDFNWVKYRRQAGF